MNWTWLYVGALYLGAVIWGRFPKRVALFFFALVLPIEARENPVVWREVEAVGPDVIGFAAGDIPKMPLNLALLKGCDIRGVFWGGGGTTGPA